MPFSQTDAYKCLPFNVLSKPTSFNHTDPAIPASSASLFPQDDILMGGGGLPLAGEPTFPCRQVDMMISMVNADGDGQVTYDEFHRVAIDPDPSRPDFCTNPVKTEPKAASSVATQVSPVTRTQQRNTPTGRMTTLPSGVPQKDD